MLALLSRTGRVLATTSVRSTAVRSRTCSRSYTLRVSSFLPTGRTSTGTTMPQTITPAVARSFASKTIADVRRKDLEAVWEAYLVGSVPAQTVFAAIDMDTNNLISVDEINVFLDSLDLESSGVKKEALEVLQRMGRDHELGRREFHMWLNMATTLRNLNPMLEGILDGVKDDSSSSDSSDSDSDDDEPPPRKMVDARRGLQQEVWDLFLTTGKHGSDLFKMVDLNRSGTISVSEIVYFIDSVDAKGVDIRDFARLKARGEDHELREKEFLAWLTAATGVIHAGGEVGGGPVEDAGGEHASIRDNAEGCTPGQW